jgi:hypothetical protein
MARVHYRIVAHDGGWAYKLNDVFSEPFPNKAAALAAAKRVASAHVRRPHRRPVGRRHRTFQYATYRLHLHTRCG